MYSLTHSVTQWLPSLLERLVTLKTYIEQLVDNIDNCSHTLVVVPPVYVWIQLNSTVIPTKENRQTQNPKAIEWQRRSFCLYLCSLYVQNQLSIIRLYIKIHCYINTHLRFWFSLLCTLKSTFIMITLLWLLSRLDMNSANQIDVKWHLWFFLIDKYANQR